VDLELLATSPTGCAAVWRLARVAAMTTTEAASASTMAVTINGEARVVPAGLSIAGLIEHLGLGGKRVAVERNKAIAPRATHASVMLAEGDRLELVTFVGGG
jgi:thiamine biosynthesis protein ThiS